MITDRCAKHGLISPLQCENELDTGQQCPNITCGDCWEYAKTLNNKLPSQNKYYCYYCLNKLVSRTKPSSNERFYDLTCGDCYSHTSSPDSSELKLASVTTKRLAVNQRRRLSNSPRSQSSSSNDDDDDYVNEDYGVDNDHSVDVNDDDDINSSTSDLSSKNNNHLYHVDDNCEVVDDNHDDNHKDNDDNDVYVDDNPFNESSSSSEDDVVEKNPYNAVTAIIPLDDPMALKWPVYSPDWYLNALAIDEDSSVKKEKFMKSNWITPELASEIQGQFPTVDEINTNSITGSCERDLVAFATKCEQLFPVGRVFMSFTQLVQASRHFLTGWNCKKVHMSKRITCFYGKCPNNRVYESTCETDKRRTKTPSMKEQYGCPFEIRYNFLKYNEGEKKDNVFYKVWITKCVATHTCQLSSQFFNRAENLSTGESAISLSAMKTLVTVLKNRPSISAMDLRPLITQFVKSDQPMDSVFVRNFRQRMIYFIACNPDCEEVTQDEAELLLSRKSITQEEHAVLDNPIIRTNFNDVLRKIMYEGSSTWEVLAFLRRCKHKIPGFDFRVRQDNNFRPDGIVWMTPMMRWNLLRYGSIFFLDMKKNQYNIVNWPYCGIVIKDHEMKIGLVCEFLGIGEDLDAYAWIIRMLSIMEPRWLVSNLMIIFGDQLITDGLLNRLDIKHTCLLRGDYYHLMNEVWPKNNNFGLVVMEKIRPWLKQMLLSPEEDVWDRAYESICRVVENDTHKMVLLDEIYDNPGYYAGYHLKQIVGNLQVNGSVSAEQNHSSIKAHLGKGNHWSICENVKELLVRQQLHAKQKNADEQSLHVQSFKYKSKCPGQEGVDEVLAKQTLSSYGFNVLFKKSSSRAKFLQSVVENDNSVAIWKAGGDRDTCRVVVINEGERCTCQEKKYWNHQCEHDLKNDGSFIAKYWDNRWYNNHLFREKFPHLSPTRVLFGHNETHFEFVSYDVETEAGLRTEAAMKSTHGNTNPFHMDAECSIDEFATDFTSEEIDVTHKISYQELMIRMGELARTVQNDQTQCQAVFSYINQMIGHYRNGTHFELSFVTHDEMSSSAVNASEDRALPIAAVTKPLFTNATRSKRKKSSLEYQNSQYSQIDNVEMSQNSIHSVINDTRDIDHLPPARARTRRCVLCSGKGHGQFTCVKLLEYGNTPLQKNNMVIRTKLSKQLSQDNSFQTTYRAADDTRIVKDGFPIRNVRAVVLHRRLVIDKIIVNPLQSSNYCIECTILRDGGEKDPKFTLVLFHPGDVGSYITRSKANLIVSLLHLT